MAMGGVLQDISPDQVISLEPLVELDYTHEPATKFSAA
jgi:hypothetical protein